MRHPSPRDGEGPGVRFLSHRGGAGWRISRQDKGRPGRLGEVEVLRQITELRGILAHRWARVRATVVRRINPLPTEEIVLDELKVARRN